MNFKKPRLMEKYTIQQINKGNISNLKTQADQSSLSKCMDWKINNYVKSRNKTQHNSPQKEQPMDSFSNSYKSTSSRTPTAYLSNLPERQNKYFLNRQKKPSYNQQQKACQTSIFPSFKKQQTTISVKKQFQKQVKQQGLVEELLKNQEQIKQKLKETKQQLQNEKILHEQAIDKLLKQHKEQLQKANQQIYSLTNQNKTAQLQLKKCQTKLLNITNDYKKKSHQLDKKMKQQLEQVMYEKQIFQQTLRRSSKLEQQKTHDEYEKKLLKESNQFKLELDKYQKILLQKNQEIQKLKKKKEQNHSKKKLEQLMYDKNKQIQTVCVEKSMLRKEKDMIEANCQKFKGEIVQKKMKIIELNEENIEMKKKLDQLMEKGYNSLKEQLQSIKEQKEKQQLRNKIATLNQSLNELSKKYQSEILEKSQMKNKIKQLQKQTKKKNQSIVGMSKRMGEMAREFMMQANDLIIQ